VTGAQVLEVLSARTLLSLRPGTRLRVLLRSGREVEAELLGNPWLVARGKPGLGRVSLRILDVEAAARWEAAFERRDRRSPRPGFEPFAERARHDVTGAQVLEVLS
jgi:hypothetical protein